MTGVEEMADTTVAVTSEETTGTAAGVIETEAEAGIVEGAAESVAGGVAAEAVAEEEITGADEEIGVEDAGVTAC